MPDSIRDLVADELSEPVDPRVAALAEAIAQQHAPASRALLFYGSCLRDRDRTFEGRVIDFYLVVADYPSAYRKRWLALVNRLISPNVFYFERDGLVAKYAVVSEADFARECGPGARNVSVAARFAQPARIAWSAGSDASDQIIGAVTRAAPALLERTLPLSTGARVLDLWKRAFSLTFAAELRAEQGDRSSALVDADPNRYQRFGEAALREIALGRGAGNVQAPVATNPDGARRWWRAMQRKGKLLSVLRLVKASFTFAGGADYIAWKINRHAGTRIELKPWQRRHPLLAGITLLPRLLRSGAIR